MGRHTCPASPRPAARVRTRPRRACAGSCAAPGPALRQCLDNLEWFRQESRTRQLPTRASAWRGAGRGGAAGDARDGARRAGRRGRAGPGRVRAGLGPAQCWCGGPVSRPAAPHPALGPVSDCARGWAGLGWPSRVDGMWADEPWFLLSSLLSR